VSAAASPIPKLTGEISRTSAVTPRGVPYENITVSISGDKAQLFVPHTAIPKTATVGVIWYYHANGSTYSAMNGAYKYSGELLVDQGAVCFCPNLGGSLWTNSAAIAYHGRAVAYLKTQFRIGVSFLRGNSGGGSMASYAYGKNLVPAAKGLYLANGTYDMEDLASRDPIRIMPVYDNSASKVVATNPARIPASAWNGKRIRVVVSDAAHPDIVVPPAKHGLALVSSARRGGAAENSVVYHQLGHQIPGLANKDMVDTFGRWLNA
ncbi:MAG: hypothetical protein ABWZ98_05720, partial [Nakamurella sp.]